jgi:hypothetical protein
MKTRILLAFALWVSVNVDVQAQQVNYKKFTDKTYWEVVSERAAKIVETMNLNNPAKEKQVQDLIAAQYYRLNGIHDNIDAGIKKVKESDWKNSVKNKKIEKLNAKRTKELDKLHQSYLKDLSAILTADQIDKVKNGMTYSVLVHTWDGYQDMLPDLTEDQKKFIWEALVEAREKAMDAGSSKEKHAWFGKYKGRINNYLSQQGYDLNKASKDWHMRLKEEGKK